VEPGEGGEDEQRSGEECGAGTKPLQRKGIDQHDTGDAGQDADQDQRQVGIVHGEVDQAAEANVEKVSRRVGLMDARVKAGHAEGEIH